MKKYLIIFLMSSAIVLPALAQEPVTWNEADRQYLVENLIRSRDELVKETQGLSKEQWNFKESPDRWSINEVVEHLAIYELLFEREIGQALASTPRFELTSTDKPDSYYLDFIMEEKPHVTVEYTKPFTYASPMGLNDLKNNMAWFLKMRNESVELVKATQLNLRAYYRNDNRPSVHQNYIYVFGHVDRGLRQIRKIKQHLKYPKK